MSFIDVDALGEEISHVGREMFVEIKLCHIQDWQVSWNFIR